MDFLEKATGALGKAATKTISVASNSASRITDAAKQKSEKRIQKKKPDNEFLYKLILKQRPNTVKDRFKIYDENGNVIYKAKGNFFLPSWTLEITDPYGLLLAKIHKKIFSIKSPFKRYEGDNVEFEIEIDRRKLGSLKNKEIGSVFDGIGKRTKDLKSSFFGFRYEYDFADMQIVDRDFIFRYEIHTKDGMLLSKSKQSYWSYGDCYTICHSSKENELLYLMMVFAMDYLHDGRAMKDKISDSFWIGSNKSDY